MLAAGSLSAVAFPWVGLAQSDSVTRHADTLRVFIDVLLPADALTPAASELGVGDGILAIASGQPLLAELILRVGDWIDTTGAGRFVDLSPADKSAVAAYLAQADVDAPEGRFFLLIRLLAIEFYDDHPSALAGLALDATPQPAGYPPPWL